MKLYTIQLLESPVPLSSVLCHEKADEYWSKTRFYLSLGLINLDDDDDDDFDYI